MGDGFDQRLVFAPARAGDGAGGGVQCLAYALTALGDVDDNFGGAESLRVVAGGGDGDRGFSVQDAMAAGDAAGGDAGDFERNDFRVEQGHDPAHGPHKALGLGGAPVHVLGPVEREGFFRQFGGENFRRGAAGALDGGADVFAFGRFHLLERGDFDTGLFGEG